METKKLEAKPIPPFTLVRADELVQKDLPPIRMVVGDCLPAGLILLAGDPKAGKSLLMQHLALCIALGEPAWGSLEVESGDVLYIANEGGERSFRDRLVKMLGGREAPHRMFITGSSEPLGERLELQLEIWLLQAANPRLIVIDTYSSVAPESTGGNRHQEDYNALAALADLATRFPDTLFVVVHHTRKAESEDVMHRISGSQGMTAATDGNAVLSRHTAARQCVLSIRPRNAEESELVLERDAETLCWSVVGADEKAQLSRSRQRVLAYLASCHEAATPKEIAAGTGLEYDAVRQLLRQMTHDKQLVSPERGRYRTLGGDPAITPEV